MRGFTTKDPPSQGLRRASTKGERIGSGYFVAFALFPPRRAGVVKSFAP